MDNPWAGQSSDAYGAQPRSSSAIDEAFEFAPADDPLGDEAAFPSTWQQLCMGDAPRD